MRKLTAALLTLIATLAGTAAAKAGVFPVNVLLANFNTIVDQNFATTSEVIGPVLIGGNLSGSGILDTSGTQVPVAGTSFTGYGEINVFGNNFGTWAETGTQHVFLGGTNVSGGSFLTAASVTTNYAFPGYNQPGEGSNALTFANDIWAQLNGTTGLSHSLAGLTANGTFSGNTFSCTGCTGPEVWNITTAQLMSATGALVFPTCLQSPTPTCDGVVNVTGTSFSSTQTFNPLTALQGLIFNFENATSVNIKDAFEASILAPDATLQSSAFIEGNVVVMNIASTAPVGAEIHYFPFDCSDNLCALKMPEPGSLVVLGSALAAFAVIRRRREPAREERFNGVI